MRLTCHDLALELACRQVRIAGKLVTPEPKVFELLAYLMQNPLRVVSKQELLDSLWWGEVVGDGVLTRCISCLRKLLADDARSPRFIRTAHRTGYEFVAPVVAHDTAAAVGEREPSPPRARPLVGRSDELAVLRSALVVRRDRPAGAWLVRGEPGVGKTRLLVEAMRGAPSVLDVHWVPGAKRERSPLSSWRRALRSLVRSRTLKQVTTAFRATSAETRRLLLAPDDAPERAFGFAPGARDREFRGVLTGLSELARSRPLALIFDDLHEADPASLALLEVLTTHAEEPIVVLGALRDTEPCADPASDLALSALRGACRNEIVLDRLDREQVRAFLASTTPSISERLVERLLARSGGNPAFLAELARSADEGDDAPIPAALRAGVCARLRALPRETRSLLELASIPAAELDVGFLARAAEHTTDHCRRWLEPAHSARWIAHDGFDRFRFAHGVAREILHDALEPEQRRRAHLAIWAALADTVGERNPRLRALLKAGAEHAAAAQACLVEAELHAEALNLPRPSWSPSPFGDRLTRTLGPDSATIPVGRQLPLVSVDEG